MQQPNSPRDFDPNFESLAVEMEGEQTEALVDLGEVKKDLTQYRAEILEPMEPSARYRAAMQRSLVALVREDVGQRFRTTSIRYRFRTRLERLGSTWRDLVDGSRSFRWASQGALALGVGLILAVVLEVATGADSAGAQSQDLAPRGAAAADEVAPAADAAAAKDGR